MVLYLQGDMMKILFKGKLEDLELVKQRLNQGDFEFVLSGEDYQLTESSKNRSTIIGRRDDKFFIIEYRNIIYVESYGHEIVCHTTKGDYYIDEKLYEIHGMFEQYGFIRIHKSYVVNKNHVISIIPEFNRKFKLLLKNENEVEVSRKYFVDFKEAIGMKVK